MHVYDALEEFYLNGEIYNPFVRGSDPRKWPNWHYSKHV